MITFTAFFRVKLGYLTIKLPEGYQGSIDLLGEKCKTGQMTFSLSKPRNPRTTGEGSQSHHLNGHIQQIANGIGDSFEDIKLAIKFEARSAGYPGREIAGHWMPQHETDCDTVECGILIETAHRVAAFLNIKLIEGVEDGNAY